MPEDTRGALAGSLGHGDQRSACIAKHDEIADSWRRTQARRATLDEASCQRFDASELTDLNVPEPVGAGAAGEGGFMERALGDVHILLSKPGARREPITAYW